MICEHPKILGDRGVDRGAEFFSHSWQPSSLIARASDPPEPPTIGGLLYPGKRTLLSGETESLKTWLALVLAKAEMDAGFAVGWADLDAMGAGELLARLRALGVADELIDTLFLYYEPDARLIDEPLNAVCETLAAHGVRMLVIDAFNPFLSLHGLDPASTSDVESFWREIATPITLTGAAPVLLDHVTKNVESRGKYAYGSERKASGAIVHIGFQLLEAFQRGGTGRSILRTHKDRPGFLPRPAIGRLVLRSDGHAVTYALEPDSNQIGDRFRPTVYMERISHALEGGSQARSKRWIEENVSGKNEHKRTALEVLVDEGYVSREDTTRGHFFESVRPYREADDERDVVVDETSPQPRPNLAPSLRSGPSRDLAPSPLPIRGEDEDEADLAPNSSPLHLFIPRGDTGAEPLPDDAPAWERDYWKRRSRRIA